VNESKATMRDPKRIDAVLAKVREVWERYPDMRLSQLIVNACRTNEAVPGVFYTEDSKLQEGLEWLLSLGKA
jgi:hypothetical protein